MISIPRSSRHLAIAADASPALQSATFPGPARTSRARSTAAFRTAAPDPFARI
eukprot:CAMPEP_0194316274 /NCGR_PEP_ID=MMETSP0171-20130528/13089_1 /TAXON_ID=218684 /ORGANISM="Corethron pennatum, Strain L29A3" /LENGTH=52 /DNA_ID=CAMNT_0039072461 /DNA_START=70 /DNA_END=228 /DNA_ORIENTATION=-